MTLLKNCKIVQDGKEHVCNILIEDGKIAGIGRGVERKGRVIDIAGKHVLPGIIDPHVHFREPGLTHKEDFRTGSRAAAAGGVTTFLDMPNTKPPTFTIGLLDEKRRLAGQKSIVNFGFHFGASADGNVGEIRQVSNVPGVKVYMNATTGNLLVEDRQLLEKVFCTANRVAVHAEREMVGKAILLREKTGTPLYLCHISMKSEIEEIRQAKKKHPKLYAEVTPHHLFLSEKDDTSSLTKVLPSLKTRRDQDALWDAISDGTVDTIGTDHAPHTLEEKQGDNIPSGFPSIETRLPLLLDAVNKGRLSLTRLTELCCHNPARIFNIRNKGFIRDGYDADLTVVDMELVKEVRNQELFTKCGWTPYNGMTLKGWPVMTIVNGNVVYGNGVIDESHRGKEVEFQ
jgi:dihydroorotase